jgi:signal transduction histidine kinase
MTELRRELGLLNATPATTTRSATPIAPAGPRSRDFWIGGGAMALALVETLAEPSFDGIDISSMSRILAVVMAATLVGRTVAPTLAALTATACLAVGAVSGHPVPDGLFFPLVVGLLLWRLLLIVARANMASAIVLVAMVCVSRALYDPGNLGINVAVMVCVCGAALAHGRGVRRTRQALVEAAPHRAQLAAVTKDAVVADRRRVAREVHDVASHAVSLIAVQAGAAEMLWDNEPEAALRAADEIDTIASSALRELEALRPGSPVNAVTWHDVNGLVRRIRSAGLDVHLDHDGVPPAALMPTVHRVVQEGLTNALRYAPGSSVRVTVTTGEDELRVAVTDDGATTFRAGHAHGFGLVGLGERVRQLGGTLTTGEVADGGFSVRATIPFQTATSPGGEAIR